MSHLIIDTQLTTRLINRSEDTDYFIDIQNYPIHFTTSLPYISRIQFPSARAILVRTSTLTDFITIHILQDTDLYSSINNFEVDLTAHHLNIALIEGSIQMSIEEANS